MQSLDIINPTNGPTLNIYGIHKCIMHAEEVTKLSVRQNTTNTSNTFSLVRYKMTGVLAIQLDAFVFFLYD